MKNKLKLTTDVNNKEFVSSGKLYEKLSLEIKSLEHLLSHQTDLQAAVLKHEWKHIRECIEIIAECNEDLLRREEERHAEINSLYKQCKLEEDAHFVSLLEHFYDEDRGRIADLYRSKNILILKLKAQHEHIIHYIRETVNHYEDVLSALFNDKATGTYSITGIKYMGDVGPIVLDWRG